VLGGRGTDDEGIFEAYLLRGMSPTLRLGQIVVMSDLSSHKGGRVRRSSSIAVVCALPAAQRSSAGPQPY